jgi:hypothetical protein
VAAIAEERVMRAYLLISGVLFGAVAVLHLLRLLYRWPAQIAAVAMPLWVSGIGLIVAALLCVWAFALVRGVRDP